MLCCLRCVASAAAGFPLRSQAVGAGCSEVFACKSDMLAFGARDQARLLELKTSKSSLGNFSALEAFGELAPRTPRTSL